MKPGIYRNLGGLDFNVVGTGYHSEDPELDLPDGNPLQLVLYHCTGGRINEWRATPVERFVSEFSYSGGFFELNSSHDIYKHYSGKKYEFLGIGFQTETLEELVFYRALYDSPKWGSDSLWVRPKSMFFEKVERDGKIVPRFEYLGRNL